MGNDPHAAFRRRRSFADEKEIRRPSRNSIHFRRSAYADDGRFLPTTEVDGHGQKRSGIQHPSDGRNEAVGVKAKGGCGALLPVRALFRKLLSAVRTWPVHARNDLGVENLLPRPSLSRKRIVPQVLARWHRPRSKTAVGRIRDGLVEAACAWNGPGSPFSGRRGSEARVRRRG